MTLVEKLNKASVEAITDIAELRSYKKKLYAIYHKHYEKRDSTPPLDFGRLLDTYEAVTKRLSALGAPERPRESELDLELTRRRMLGADTKSLEPVTLIEGAVALVGGQAEDPANTDVANVYFHPLITEEDETDWAGAHIIKMLGKDGYKYFGDLPDVSVPLYDLVLVPCEKARRRIAKPLPSPKDNEEQKEFISRCMGNPTMNSEYSDSKQRAAVCHSQWRRAKKSVLKMAHVIVKEEEERIVGGIVYEPNVEDSQGDYTTAEEIRQAMYGWMENSQTMKAMHSGQKRKVFVIESFQPETDVVKFGHTVPAGAWWLLVRVRDNTLWKQVKDGDISGFSMAGTASVGEDEG